MKPCGEPVTRDQQPQSELSIVQTKTILTMLTGALLAATQLPAAARADIVFSANGRVSS